jgi:ubiquinone/menaquinone biosynthesis C-methylase UbiE
MDHFHGIYAQRAAAYHRLIAAEDAQGSLRTVFATLGDLRGRWLDVGSGTGRIPLLLRDASVRVVGLDLHDAMLREQAAQRDLAGGTWPLVRGDIRLLPFRTASFDVVTAGWALGHARGWHPEDWRDQIGTMLGEMHRVAVPGAAIVVLETLSTGATEPAPPSADLGEYYTWLESTWGFTRHTLQTDYVFRDIDAAVEATEFFFGPELTARIRANGWSRVPEWTGMWSRRTPAIRSQNGQVGRRWPT